MPSFKVKLPPNQKEITLAMPYGSITIKQNEIINNELFYMYYPDYFYRIDDGSVSLEYLAHLDNARLESEIVAQDNSDQQNINAPVDEKVEPPKNINAPVDEKVEPPKITGEVKVEKIKKNLFQRG